MTSDEIELLRLKADIERYHRLLNEAHVRMGDLQLRNMELEREVKALRDGRAA